MRLLDVPQFKGLAELEERFGIQCRLHGGLPHRLFLAERRQSPLDLFETSSLLGDIDLIHTGLPSITSTVMTQLFETLPSAECFRWQLRSYGEEDIFHEARAFNNVIPALRIAVHRHAHDDPMGGVADIERGQYRFSRNPRYRESLLYLAGRDVEAASALFYLRVLMTSGLDDAALREQPGLDAARDVFLEDATTSTMEKIRGNAWLRARLFYLVHSVTAAALSERAVAFLEERVGWQEFSRYLAAAGVALPPFRVPEPGMAAAIPARLGGDIYRLGDERVPWLAGHWASDALSRRLHEVDRTSRESREPSSLARGQEVLLASPMYPLASGISGSSYSDAPAMPGAGPLRSSIGC